MAFESAAERASFLDPSVFGVAATITITGQAAASINVIFDEPFVMQDIGDTEYQSSAPQAVVLDSDISGLQQNDTIVIDSTTYKIIEWHAGGQGMTILFLQEQ